MKQIFLALLLLSSFLGSLFAQKLYTIPKGAEYKKSTFVIKIKSEHKSLCSNSAINIPELQDIFNQLQKISIQKMFPSTQVPKIATNSSGQKYADLTRTYRVSYGHANQNLEQIINLVLKTNTVEYAEPDFIHKTFYDPNDPDTTFSQQPWIELFKARNAWSISQGDTNIVISVIDTGTDLDHPDLAGNLYINWNDPIDGTDNDGDGYTDNFYGWDFAGANWTTLIQDNNPDINSSSLGHGVFSAGCAAMVTDNTVGGASPGFSCHYMPLKCAADNYAAIFNGYDAVVYAADHGADIINLSWGSTAYSQTGEDAIRYAAINKNKLIVAAAGNDGNSEKYYPAALPYVTAVAFVNNNMTKHAQANYGCHIDLCGTSNRTTAYNNSYFTYSASSLAAPLISSVAAFAKSNFPTYTGLQVGELIRVSGTNIDSLNSGYEHLLGNGLPNMAALLTYSGPAIRWDSISISDNQDNYFHSGDTIQFSMNFVNYLDSANNISIKFRCDHPNITILDSSFSIGSLATLSAINNFSAPFRVAIDSDMPVNQEIVFYCIYEANGGYKDEQSVCLNVNECTLNMAVNNVSTSCACMGRFGFQHYNPSNPKGLGFAYKGIQGFYAGGVALSSSTASDTTVSSVMLSGLGTFENDFIPKEVMKYQNNPISELFIHGSYEDTAAKVSVKQNSYAFTNVEDDDYVIFEYTFFNDGLDTLKNVYFSEYADFRFNDIFKNRAGWDSLRKMNYTYDDNNNLFLGVSLISDANAGGFADSLPLVSFHFQDDEIYTAQASGTSQATIATSGTATYVYHITTAGAYTLAPGDSQTVAFAVLGGNSLNQLQNNADAAKLKYFCHILGNKPIVDLGKDSTFCADSIPPITLDAGAGFASYNWDNGDTTQTTITNQSICVTVTDTNACQTTDCITLEKTFDLSGGISANSMSVSLGDTIHFTNNTTGADSLVWDFGDGNTSFNTNPTHVYDSIGIYTVKLYLFKGTCMDSVELILNVTVSKENELLSGKIKVYPNPVKNLLKIDLDKNLKENVELILFDMSGKQLISKQIFGETTSQTTISMESLGKGVYFLKVKTKTAQTFVKIIRL